MMEEKVVVVLWDYVVADSMILRIQNQMGQVVVSCLVKVLEFLCKKVVD